MLNAKNREKEERTDGNEEKKMGNRNLKKEYFMALH